MSVLDDMTKGIRNTAATKQAKLTPVPGEATTTVASMAAAIPDLPEFFLTAEMVMDMARDIRAQGEKLIAVADALDNYKPEYMKTPDKGEVKAAMAEVSKAAEKAGDAAFKERFEKQQAEAQAATFADLDVTEQAVIAGGTGWTCPEHGSDRIQVTTSRQGRTYGICMVDDCEHYEKESK